MSDIIARHNVALNGTKFESLPGTLVWDITAQTLDIRRSNGPDSPIRLSDNGTFEPHPGCVYLKEYVEGRGVHRIDYRGITDALLAAGAIKRVLISHIIGNMRITMVELVEDLGASVPAPANSHEK